MAFIDEILTSLLLVLRVISIFPRGVYNGGFKKASLEKQLHLPI